MPNLKSAKKALRQNRKHYEANKSLKTKMKSMIKKISAETASATVSVIDKAAKKNLIHKNKAARLKSKLVKKLELGGKGLAKRTSSKSAKKKTAKTKSSK